MKILIIGAPRCGTTTLTKSLSEILDLEAIIEPWNGMYNTNLENLYTHTFNGNIVLKTMVEHTPHDVEDFDGFIKGFVKNFNNVILLGRKNIQACLESFAYQWVYDGNDPDFWHENYIFNNKLDVEPYRDEVTHWLSKLDEVSNYLDIPITWYEDLYSGDEKLVKEIIKSWNLNIETTDLIKFVTPLKRYRRFN